MGSSSSKECPKKQGPPSYPRHPEQGTSAAGYPTAAPTVPGAPPGYGQSTAPPPPPGPPSTGFDYNAPPPYVQQQQTVVTHDAFEAGARFNHGAVRHIPPPPPGAAPNAAQMAAMQGHNVVIGQREQTFMGGTGDAGAVVW